MRSRRWFGAGGIAVGLAVVVACGKRPPPREPTITETASDGGSSDASESGAQKAATLFDRLGGKDGLSSVVDSVVLALTQHDGAKKRFAKYSKDQISALRAQLQRQLCKAGAGECDDASAVADGPKAPRLNEAEWNVTVTALRAALEERHVDENEQYDFVAALAQAKEELVEVKPKARR